MIDSNSLAWERMDGLIPAIVQDAASGEVRMLGYMNRAALDATVSTGLVTFFSRSRNELWQKGETSGNSLALVSIAKDCDGDALLITATSNGPTCHNGTSSCFGDDQATGTGFITNLERILADRATADPATSYTAPTDRRGHQTGRAEGWRGRRRDRACRGCGRRCGSRQRSRRPYLPPHPAAPRARPVVGAGGRRIAPPSRRQQRDHFGIERLARGGDDPPAVPILAAVPVADRPASAAHHRDQRVEVVALEPAFDH